MKRVTIIETGLISERHRAHHGSLPEMFERMIGAEDPSITFDVVSVVNGEPLPDPDKLQAILITGSPAGVYDEFGWIAPLESFVRTAHASGTPMAGVCFGHQLMAQALGGTVRKSEKGWGIGRHVYEVALNNGVIDEPRLAIACTHQDQVVEPPPGAQTFLFSEFTPHAGLLYAGGTAMSVQPHPEFTVSFAHLCCDLCEGNAPEAVIATAKASLADPLDHAKLGRAITRFLMQGKTAPSPIGP